MGEGGGALSLLSRRVGRSVVCGTIRCVRIPYTKRGGREGGRRAWNIRPSLPSVFPFAGFECQQDKGKPGRRKGLRCFLLLLLLFSPRSSLEEEKALPRSLGLLRRSRQRDRQPSRTRRATGQTTFGIRGRPRQRRHIVLTIPSFPSFPLPLLLPHHTRHHHHHHHRDF